MRFEGGWPSMAKHRDPKRCSEQERYCILSNGNPLTLRDARGNITRHEYDALDRLSRRTDPLNRAETFSYDGNGNLTSTTDRKNQPTTFIYDPLNRRTRAEYADGTVATFTYDAGNRLTQVDDTADPHRPITRTYDPLDRMLTETTSLGTVTYTYDTAGGRTTMTAGGQPPVTYGYDAASRLLTLTQAPLNPATLQYDAQGRRTLLTLPNGVSTEYQYDAASEPTTLIYRNALGTTLGTPQYTYDGNGNRLATGGSWARTTLPAAVSSSTYDQANEQLAFGGTTQAFDANGNLQTQTTTGGTTTYTWNARNRLVGLSGPTVSAAFAYDALGRRVAKTINGQSTSFLYDGLDAVRESGASGDAAYLRSLAIDEALSRIDATGTAHYLADGLGSTVALADGGGGIPTTYTYAPFGETAIGGSPSPNPFQFTERENDSTGLYYYRARYYHPGLGRFVSEDPIGLAGGDINLYAYVGNSPVRFIDPTGHFLMPLLTRLAAAFPRLYRITALAGYLRWFGRSSRPPEPIKLPPIEPPAKMAPKDPPYTDPKGLLPPIPPLDLSPEGQPVGAPPDGTPPPLSGRKTD